MSNVFRISGIPQSGAHRPKENVLDTLQFPIWERIRALSVMWRMFG